MLFYVKLLCLFRSSRVRYQTGIWHVRDVGKESKKDKAEGMTESRGEPSDCAVSLAAVRRDWEGRRGGEEEL